MTLVDPLGPLNAYVNDPVARPTSSGQVMTFGVSLSSPVGAERTVTIPYATASAAAIAGTFHSGVGNAVVHRRAARSQTVNVPLLNASVSTAKTFKLVLGEVVGALAVDKTGVATIAPG